MSSVWGFVSVSDMLQWGNSVGIARAVEGTSPALICVHYELTTVLRHSQAQLAEFNRFKMEDVPPRLETKQRLLRLFDEIQVSRGPRILLLLLLKSIK